MLDLIEVSRGMLTASRLDPDPIPVRFAQTSIEKTTGQEPHLLPDLGGSLANDWFANVLGLPTVWSPHLYAACGQHAPNEPILKPCSAKPFWR
ncbi:hypothetical protein [Cohaesibacter intestini]|uniref:hypothetical protein n=1 Tax=Cohaesibacter intestini TaxID=2211145 RepID=UPI000DEB1983|nr:hypothetical protein [Cohaesibacter intestini]